MFRRLSFVDIYPNFHLLSSVAILILSVNYSTFSRLCNRLVAGGGAARWAGAVRRAVLAEAHPGSKARAR